VALRLITAPSVEPVTVAEAKTHCRITTSVDDTYVGSLITACRQTAELELSRALLPQTWEVTRDKWPNAIRLDNAPLIAVTSVKYLEAVAGVLTTLSTASYVVDTDSEPAYVQPAYTYDWPDLWPEINAVRVRYTCGYADAASVPAAIKQWILLMIGHYYENRESSVISEGRATVDPLPYLGGLLDQYRVPVV
jgi:uncharacterized phiE125 gp8 family phage protein